MQNGFSHPFSITEDGIKYVLAKQKNITQKDIER
jgi:hypothetical protein